MTTFMPVRFAGQKQDFPWLGDSLDGELVIGLNEKMTALAVKQIFAKKIGVCPSHICLKAFAERTGFFVEVTHHGFCARQEQKLEEFALADEDLILKAMDVCLNEDIKIERNIPYRALVLSIVQCEDPTHSPNYWKNRKTEWTKNHFSLGKISRFGV